MRSRRRTVAASAISVLIATSAAAAPPVAAQGRKHASFVGLAVLDAGLSAPCATSTTVTPPDTTVTKGTKTCPPQVGPGTTSKHDNPFHVNGNTRSGTFVAGACISSWLSFKKFVPVGIDPACSIQGIFTITGYCGLAQARGTGTARIGLQSINFSFTWSDVGGNVVVRGWWTSSTTQRGDVFGYSEMEPQPILSGNSCMDKTARVFRFDGDWEFMNPKTTES